MTRKFELVRDPRHYWVYGNETRNLEGDYYFDGHYQFMTMTTLEECSMSKRMREVTTDPDLVVDEGL